MMEEANNDADLLSQLPTDVLLLILDKLDLRAAVRAGILSRRWRRLPDQLPRLSLRMEDFLPPNVTQHRYYDEEEEDGGVGPGRRRPPGHKRFGVTAKSYLC
ncbi:unnamed protein product [Urochloa humidicola]